MAETRPRDAAGVGVDAALVIRYFGSKQNLFATATEFRIDLPPPISRQLLVGPAPS